MFATHYHELTELAERCDRIQNYQVEVQEIENDILFTHRVIPGHSNHSFGIHVAKMAGMPHVVLATAKTVLQAMEGNNARQQSGPASMVTSGQGQVSLFELREDRIRSIITELDINNMTPMQALQTLMDLRKTIDE
jgi:DNA mismatch repair protein MutS